MNNKIREIAKQALDYAEKNQSADIPQHWFELHNKKFAELIIEECVGAIMTKERHRAEYFARVVQRRFGILDDGDDE